ncbi:MAG TPA: hypothetical protein VK809_07340 [Bacteroidia bacterium]|jgi:hypothetical protein|nr:hypothetical protein [Bacteroidia bacterium]
MSKRDLVIKSLIEINADINTLIQELSKYPWDSEPLITLSLRHVKNALYQYLQGNISALELENWANAVEMRDDIEYEYGNEKTISKVLSELSNPVISQPIDKDHIEEIINSLR